MRARRLFVAAGLVAVVVAASLAQIPRAGAIVLPPANDDFAHATALQLGTNQVIDVSAATTETGEPNTDQFAGGSIWWTYQSATTTRVHLQFSCAFLMVFRVADPGFAGLTDVTPDFSDTQAFRAVTFDATGGSMYAIQCGNFTGLVSAQMNAVVASIPANDNFANAAPVTLGAPTAAADITGASQETGEPGLFGPYEKSLWWVWTAPRTDA